MEEGEHRVSYSLGLDVGSYNAKLALIGEDCNVDYLDIEKATSGPQAAVSSLISRLSKKFDLQEITTAGVSGSGRAIIPKELRWTNYSSSLSIAAGLLHHHPEAKTIIQIGGQSSLVIELEDGLRKPWKVASNPLCAAGTGRFLEQQAYRLGIGMDDFARLALEFEGSPPRIAARCSVFAKTDLIHLQQKGVSVQAMLYALCESIARMVASLKKGAFEEPVYFVGGVAGNNAILNSLKDVLSARNGRQVKVVVPEDHLHIEAMGSALLSRESGNGSRVVVLQETDSRERYLEMPGLERVIGKDGWKAPKVDQPFTGYLGVDVGSTSTKAVIVDESGTKVVAKSYLMTAGRPIDAVKEVFGNLLRDAGDKARIAGVGVTGSGRYLVGGFIGADLIKNEITAQARAAAEIDSEADIIEIGGQDSKLVLKRNGVVVDYQMNKACAAGTGSFIDELADMLGVSVNNGDFTELAFAAPYTIDLGTRCAAFMGQSVASAQQEGMPLEVITASLADSIARNYFSKVVGIRKLGEKVILTGAVFHNQAVVSAFRRQLKGKTLIVAEHKGVSGAIGAALLAKEEASGPRSSFKGFQQVVDSDCTLSSFTCKGCDNNCAITRMEMPDEKPTFYGSRCDRYDSAVDRGRKETAFDERERLLLREYRDGFGTGPSVGIPRALMVHDYAPLLLGFLNGLGARAVVSDKTNQQIMEQAVELSYSDSCFPLKLLHGHAQSLNDVDFIFYPCVTRMGVQDGNENQKYACPLVQASPFIIRQVLDLGKRLLIPIIDFSRGDGDTIRSLTDVAVDMGFSRRRGKEAALLGIEAQRKFGADQAELGRKLLAELHRGNQLGVVLLSRSYLSQDSGANLGIAEKLAQLGVVPIPVDFLPLASIDPKEYSDRPYWMSEAKHIAAAAIIASDPSLYGLMLTNFGCGPNSFILNIVQDIMGAKPLGQLEIDEHSAEAGIVTRLEAFVDTIRGFARSSTLDLVPPGHADLYRAAPAMVTSTKLLLIPRMAPHAEILAASVEACGGRATVLPEPNERNLLYADQVTSGKECLPYRVTLGDFMRFFHEDGTDPEEVEGFTGGSFGPCRLGKYALEQIRILKEIGFDLPIRTSVSNNGYRDWDLGLEFERLAWKGCVAVDSLQRLVWRTRPYEESTGAADSLFDKYLGMVADRTRKREPLDDVLRQAATEFKSLINPDIPRRPLVGINGEIYLRSNRFSNSDLVKVCEAAGLEVIVSSVGEWFKYATHRKIEDAIKGRQLKQMITGYLTRLVQERIEHSIADDFKDFLDIREPSTNEILRLTSRHLSPKCGSEAVLSIGSGIEWMESPRFAGVISVMPHGCMPGGIVAAMSEKLSATYEKPWISLTYDGFLETNNLARINDFAEIIRFCARGEQKAALAHPSVRR